LKRQQAESGERERKLSSLLPDRDYVDHEAVFHVVGISLMRIISAFEP
jgi:hypothetical protein